MFQAASLRRSRGGWTECSRVHQVVCREGGIAVAAAWNEEPNAVA
jgi:hypothetical protein